MAVRERYVASQLIQDLERKMVFVAGPRQVGKTTLARSMIGGGSGYMSWDIERDRERILKRELPPTKFWVFDEIHKYRSWRNYLKGLYDGRVSGQRIMVTGSGRLDLYRFGGDSLQGRYHLLRLHPFSVAELGLSKPRELSDLLTLGGFPEPYLDGSEIEARRWSREYRTRLIREDLVSLERLQDLGNLELLMLHLPERVGSPLSINALREDLQISHKTLSNWLIVFEKLYAIFRISPFGAPRLRAVKKEVKHYHFDWTIVPKGGPRFENLVAAHLLKWVHFQEDTQGRDIELRYFRDKDGREVDFVVVEGRDPLLLVECKWSDTEVDRGLRYLKNRFPDCPAWQVTATGRKDYVTESGIRVAPACKLLETLV